ncbi:hypothetical protein COCC4DRAFT_205849 [Bipolaris maydis ATCC 48331]|uniref:Protein kinase domain-containing protein n=2 Tax=Cochliobolus heterostrophus TaxID=5016 RepID=M2UP26_COCH5|nr:uncharacterized protein COCC4DRAFT_205849 [Bipolaris maydis ATCC 48331]EMD95321.1 hypothetical protein COCHEDRAFT_1191993 [Bipolaris maydis C5]KAJ5021930.1 hypothetical protein J3E73DRAFT_385639 [Bipolaris maydis]ENI00468.1 hypothetical protein COCC4DRAFT_205849 [Bipolaris maydis ATCC 48331]KAJ6202973.1 hypothetical protein J3E72DRAFT_381417 [Bipolaris maydis]KAJ6214320.1 hypothetical protein PSV09DRAFT_1191993 [Bipolaris maydis]
MDKINHTKDLLPTPGNSPGPSRSRAQRQTPGPISTRFNYDVEGFLGGPNITVKEDNGYLRPINENDFRRSPSSDASTVHKVEDLGFSAAAATFDFESIKKDGLCALQRLREEREAHFNTSNSPKTARFESTLRKRFEESLEVSKPAAGEYLPLDMFRNIFNPASIMLLLDERFPSPSKHELMKRFQNIISQDAKKTRTRILGVLVAMEGLDHLEEFVTEDIWDKDLPFKQSRESTPNSKSSILDGWNRNDRVLFYEYQRVFFVPFFDIHEKGLCSYELDRETRLPWVSIEPKSTGGTGLVYQVEIHPSHHNFSKSGSTDNPKFALKEIDASEQRAYRKELHALEKTCAHAQTENHLIKLLLTFQHGNTFYLLFEWANGNLQQFWDTNPYIQRTPSNELWAAQQCLGLARAVSRIHGLSSWHEVRRKKNGLNSIGSQYEDKSEWGRHGDIKPENILWFEQHGTCRRHLVISDLGLARYHTEFSKSLVPRAMIDGITWGYRAPEVDFREPISSKYDIFSLGCVFLEFCIWYLRGAQDVGIFGLEREDQDEPEFDDVRKDQFFCMKGDGNTIKDACLKECVQKRLSQLKEGTNFTRGLASVIEDRMLRCNPSERSKIDLIRVDLQHLVDTLKNSPIDEQNSQDFAQLSANPGLSTLLDTKNTLRKFPSHLTLDSHEETSSMEGHDTSGARSSRSEQALLENNGHDDSHSDYDDMPIEPMTDAAEPAARSKLLQAEVQEVSGVQTSHSMAEPQTTKESAEHPTTQNHSIGFGDGKVEANRRSTTTRFRHARTRSKQWVRDTWSDVKGVWK